MKRAILGARLGFFFLLFRKRYAYDGLSRSRGMHQELRVMMDGWMSMRVGRSFGVSSALLSII